MNRTRFSLFFAQGRQGPHFLAACLPPARLASGGEPTDKEKRAAELVEVLASRNPAPDVESDPPRGIYSPKYDQKLQERVYEARKKLLDMREACFLPCRPF